MNNITKSQQYLCGLLCEIQNTVTTMHLVIYTVHNTTRLTTVYFVTFRNLQATQKIVQIREFPCIYYHLYLQPIILILFCSSLLFSCYNATGVEISMLSACPLPPLISGSEREDRTYEFLDGNFLVWIQPTVLFLNFLQPVPQCGEHANL